MKNAVAVWIDHTQAKVIAVAPERAEIVRTIESGVIPHHKGEHEGHPRIGPGHEHIAGPAGHDDRYRHQQLEKFYDAVLKAIGTPDRLAIFGPDGARGEFERTVRAQPALAPHLKGVIPLGRETDAQLIAEARAFFGVPAGRMGPSRHAP
ncbi:MAG TPA: hypothetical protein DEB06_08700 [Phycisphaerales bacterium]|nr:hypothetical protein [Phycisphaerales bacterium]